MTEAEARAYVAGNVPRETVARIEQFDSLLRRWSTALNLVSAATLAELWARHVADSVQLWVSRPAGSRLWADIGTGGGFPGMVVAICAADDRAGPDVVMVESDRRKAAFLNTAARVVGIRARVVPARAEAVAPLGADVVSARAVAPLLRLFPMVHRHLAHDGVALLPKGRGWAGEWGEAQADWAADLSVLPSVTDPDSAILACRSLARRRSDG
jgi:16S rRNA (guanine527-N7)-methyltransferase